jgi:hypothetical protein
MNLGTARTPSRQRGAETVEFLLTLLVFFLVFFMIVDFAIATFDQGTVMNTSRDACRQASLYWVDPATFDPETPLQNQKVKRSMVDTVVTWAESNLVIDPGGSGLSASFQINSVDVEWAIEVVSPGDVVSVDVSYPHQFIGLSSLAGVSGMPILGHSVLGVEG